MSARGQVDIHAGSRARGPSDQELREVALTRSEYDLIVKRLGRPPNRVELGMLGVLWSEHCSYKSSRRLLRRLPTTGPGVLQGPGENAGAVDVGDGWACVFKVESHNHPSAIEPYQGAATGVGGILRDVIAMGARPVALLDSLRFGALPESAWLFEGVVAGIGGYGNCIGVPTVGGEIYFDDSYSGNPLVNAMCVGLVRIDELKRAQAGAPGNILMLVGADTGRDGIHGASFASLELDDSSHERRPAVQVGNPFLEKCLLEACLEMVAADTVVGIQDLGAAGLTSSVAEVAARAGTGVRLDVERVPRRERGMSAYEVMLSESQERMLVIATPAQRANVARICERWDLTCEVVGMVTGTGEFEVYDGRERVAVLPVELLAEGAPERSLTALPAAAPPLVDGALAGIQFGEPDIGPALLRLLASPNLCSRRPVFRRYDHMVGNRTVVGPGGDAAVVRILGTRRALALTIDGNGRHCRLDPREGARLAVCEAARNIVATGARPVAVTDCLNFGNPERPEVYWQLEQVIEGMADACRGLRLPVVSGNVSLYNESERGGRSVAIHPTPVVGMVGVLDDYRRRLSPAFRQEGDFVLMIGTAFNELGGSEYLATIHGVVAGPVPRVDLARELGAMEFLLQANQQELLHTAHDISDGGMLVALAESALLSGIGVRCPPMIPDPGLRLDAAFFGESQGRFLVSCPPRAMPQLQSLARRHRVELLLLGLTGGDAIEFEGQMYVTLEQAAMAWERPLQHPEERQ